LVKYPYEEGKVPYDRPKTNRGLGLPRWFAVLDYFFLLRPMILIPVWLFLLLGHYHALAAIGAYRWPDQLLPDLDLVIVFVAFTILVGGIYVNNQIHDRETDRRNRKLYLICDGYVSLKKAWLYQGAVQGLALASCLWFRDSGYLWVIVASILLGFLYNTPPFKLKGRPVLDVLANGLGNGLLNVAVGYVVVLPLTWGFLKFSLPYVLAVGAVFANTTCMDTRGDAESGERTTAVVFGVRATTWIALGLMAGCVALAAVWRVWPALIAGGVSLPLFIPALTGKRRWLKLSYKGVTGIFALGASALFPWFLVFLVLILLLTRYYYRRKFGIRYP
jgi:4-hydroxybenzoate polyprenyltransferase